MLVKKEQNPFDIVFLSDISSPSTRNTLEDFSYLKDTIV